jgi:Mn2+/Fe2+ NRAMP family transporter
MNKLALILPGLLVAATGVGAGDLISGALAGHYLGLALWVPLVGALLKYILTEGIARFQFAHNKPLVHGWIEDLGLWIKGPFFIYLIIWSYMVGGALINANGSALNSLFPIDNGKYIYGALLSILGMLFVLPGNFNLFEKIMALLVGIMFITVISTAFSFLESPMDILLGLTKVSGFSFRDSWFLAVLGGVGGTLTILSYGYWLQEEKREGIEGLKISRIDLAISYFLTALFSIAMMILGNQLSEVSKDGALFVDQVAQLFNSKLGPWGQTIFKVGFFCGVFSSLLGVWQSVPYLFADLYSLHFKNSDSQNKRNIKKGRPYRLYLLAMAIIPLSSLWLKFQAIQLFYAVIGAFFIPLCALSLLILNNKGQKDNPFKNNLITNGLLVFTLLFFAANGARIVFDKF